MGEPVYLLTGDAELAIGLHKILWRERQLRGFRHSGRRLRPLPHDDAERGGGGCECSRLPSAHPITVAINALSS